LIYWCFCGIPGSIGAQEATFACGIASGSHHIIPIAEPLDLFMFYVYTPSSEAAEALSFLDPFEGTEM
jgi:hypothetical protein